MLKLVKWLTFMLKTPPEYDLVVHTDAGQDWKPLPVWKSTIGNGATAVKPWKVMLVVVLNEESAVELMLAELLDMSMFPGKVIPPLKSLNPSPDDFAKSISPNELLKVKRVLLDPS